MQDETAAQIGGNIGALTAAIAILASKLSEADQKDLVDGLKDAVDRLDAHPEFGSEQGSVYVSAFTSRAKSISRALAGLK